MGSRSPTKKGLGATLESLHLYRKVPRDLTDATHLGGVISLVCAALMAYLFISNIMEYMRTTTTTDVALDETGETTMRVYFNITMERLPCQFASVDVSDIMGTSITNVTKDLIKFKVAPEAGHRQEFYMDDARVVMHEEFHPEETKTLMKNPTQLPTLSTDNFESWAKSSDLVLVAFGAPWCPWSQRLEPVWRALFEVTRTKKGLEDVRIGKVDCTAADSQQLCHKHHIHAFPTIRVYRHKQMHSHENYLGDRTIESFTSFIQEMLPKHPEDRSHLAAINAPTESHSLEGEGCQLTGSLKISRVPGSFRISAQSDSHSFNTRVMNVSHHVDRLMFASGREERLRQVVPLEQRSTLLSSSFMMHEELATLKHYLKVVPFQYVFLDEDRQHTYLYKANYNEYRPRKKEWYEGKADAYIDTELVPNAVFYYDISPVMVVVNEETQSFASFVTKICAVIGGIYTVIGLVDNLIYHGGNSIKKAM